MSFVNDFKNGEEKTFFENGKLSGLCFYKDGKMDGKNTHWNEKEKVVFEGEYKDGLRHGKLLKYNDDGSIALEQNFLNDKLHGEKKKYEKNGEVVISQYDNGVKIK
jgi:antitoxin component YwqK of YwqJK toxin-antitoxin module